MKTIFALHTAGAFEWRPAHISFKTLQELKEHCVKEYGFSKEILIDDRLFRDELEGYEMKYEEVILPKK
jgi:hypothetical protein